LHDLERYEEALTVYTHILEINPSSAVAYHNRGNTLLALDQLPEAIASYEHAAGLMPDSAEPLVPMGTALERLGHYQEAMTCYHQALQRDPGCAEAHWNKALLNLLLGNYREGWTGFAWRWLKKGYPTQIRDFGVSEWRGEPLIGKTILIHAEQGLGDTIQFGRFIPLIAERGGRVVLEVPFSLCGLFEGMPGIVAIVPTGAPLPIFDLHVPLLSLPQIFGTTSTNIPARTPNLATPLAYKKKWQLLMPRNSNLKVGIVWKGRKVPDPSRSCPVGLLGTLAGIDTIQFYSLQLSEGEQPVRKPEGLPLIDLTAWITDFSDTAALLERLDLVISIDTSVVHLAGSLGCPTWVLLPFAADWRWLLNREDSPWYPNARLFRQTEPGDWQQVLNRVRKELLQWSAKTVPSPCDNAVSPDYLDTRPPTFITYIPGRDYYLEALCDGRDVPVPYTASSSDGTTAPSAFYVLNKDLYRLQNNIGIEGVSRFISELPCYHTAPERHIFWSSHDNPIAPDEKAIFCKASASLLDRGRIITVPYVVEDLVAFARFTPEQICWHTCFVGYPGSSLIRERMLLSIAGSSSISSQLDIAPKFHSHLDAATKEKRRQIYLETMTKSLTVLCPRGDGMSSIRFFEALSIGRIPVLISDWCALPFDYLISYDRFVIRIAECDVEKSGELISAWISDKSPEDLLERCREARKAWEQWLSPSGIEKGLTQAIATLDAAVPSIISTGHTTEEQLNEDHLAAGLRRYDAGDTAGAEACFRKAISAGEDTDEAISCLALLLNEQGRCAETITLLAGNQPDIRLKPELARLLGEAYHAEGLNAAAYAQYAHAAHSFPNDSQLLMNLGVVCDSLDRQDEAITYLNRARELAPDNPQIRLNLGGVLQSVNRLADAEFCYREALRLRPDYGTASWNLAQLLLLEGKYSEGFRLFESRFTKRDPVPRSALSLPYWNGEPLNGRSIVVTTEQAFGDAIQFSRYAVLLAEQGAKVTILNHLQPLQSLLESLPGVSVINNPSQVPATDFQIPMLSLPRVFGTTAGNIPAQVPYLCPQQSRVNDWREKLPPATGVRIGLVWAGRPLPDPRRSASLRDFAPFGAIPGIDLVSLQIGPGSEETASPPAGMTILDITHHIQDFEDTAALMAHLDLVISIDTSAAHLAGAMGKPVLLLLPFSHDWRWFMERPDSPWYPTMHIFRQTVPGEWNTVISAVAAQLTRLTR
jgi:tetratricopeptide (TPR) repeat protein